MFSKGGGFVSRNLVFRFLFATLIASLPSRPVHGLEITVPSGFSGDASGSTPLPLANGPRTFQQQVVASRLGLNVGDRITGLTFRYDMLDLSNSPASVYSDDTIVLARATNALSGMSTIYASNMTDPQTVRSGTLSLPAGAFTGGSSTNAFGSMINFSSAYTYQGGDLVVYVTHSSGTGALGAVEAVLNTALSDGYGSQFRAIGSNSGNAPSSDLSLISRSCNSP